MMLRVSQLTRVHVGHRGIRAGSSESVLICSYSRLPNTVKAFQIHRSGLSDIAKVGQGDLIWRLITMSVRGEHSPNRSLRVPPNLASLQV